MSNVLVFSFARQGFQEACQLELASDYYKNGDNVLYVTCGRSIGICTDNDEGDIIRCLICKSCQKQRARLFVDKKINQVCLDDYCTKEIRNKADEFIISYSNVSELKSLTYHDIDVGYGALSSYVSYTRNIDLSFNSEMRDYIDSLIRMEIREILSCENIIKEFHPDLIVLHNGRFAHYKPLLGLAQINNIRYVLTETITAADGSIKREFYDNNIPHDNHVRAKMIQSFWDVHENDDNRLTTAISFFENRKHAKFAGDTIYAKGQKLGKLPDGWNRNKYNIAIFNSSEDEFFAISKIVDNQTLFKTQLEGIKIIAEHYQNNPTIHFTLRVHPHLKEVGFSYHQDLYKLNLPNLTVIPADSDISTYSIMDACDKVLVFGSTMGVESSFWGKPTINCGYALYEDLGVTYNPKNLSNLWDLIDDLNLSPLQSEGALMYGYYFMSNKHESFHNVPLKKTTRFKLLGRDGVDYKIYKLFGSSYLYSRIEKLYVLINRRFKLFHKFKNIPL